MRGDKDIQRSAASYSEIRTGLGYASLINGHSCQVIITQLLVGFGTKPSQS